VFKQPAALKRLNQSIESAEKALAELRKQGGSDVGQAATAVYKDLRGFVSNARRHSGRLAKALERDFKQAQKQATSRTTARTSRTSATRSSRAGSTSRSSGKRATTTRTRRKTS
jgi:hypothetical protein